MHPSHFIYLTCIALLIEDLTERIDSHTSSITVSYFCRAYQPPSELTALYAIFIYLCLITINVHAVNLCFNSPYKLLLGESVLWLLLLELYF